MTQPTNTSNEPLIKMCKYHQTGPKFNTLPPITATLFTRIFFFLEKKTLFIRILFDGCIMHVGLKLKFSKKKKIENRKKIKEKKKKWWQRAGDELK